MARRRSAITSWGGTTSRSWFYDFSAGPEYNTTNWVVDVEDLNGDGTPEYRMPPVWEYASKGYREPALLSTEHRLEELLLGLEVVVHSSLRASARCSHLVHPDAGVGDREAGRAPGTPGVGR